MIDKLEINPMMAIAPVGISYRHNSTVDVFKKLGKVKTVLAIDLIDSFICRPDYWLVIYKVVGGGWQFSLYFPQKNFYCKIDFYYSTRLGCMNSAKKAAVDFLEKISRL